ncbi:MAG: hypothetical protein HY652_13705 [Acidobacteria bacterium]|nr:hypothetical protein [Acidobacteriota bacterium]
MKCPKCGFDQAEDLAECQKCGVIFSRMQQKLQELEQPTAAELLEPEAAPQKRRTWRYVRWAVLLGLVASLWMALRKPAVPTADFKPEDARRLQEKLVHIQKEAPGILPRETQIEQNEVNSFVAERLDLSPKYLEQEKEGKAVVKALQMALEGDQMAVFVTLSYRGQPLYLTLKGRPYVQDGFFQFQASSVSLGSLPFPAGIVERSLKEAMERPEFRDQLRVPDHISGIAVENGRLVIRHGGVSRARPGPEK